MSCWEFGFKCVTTTDRSLHATVVNTQRITTHTLLCVSEPGVVDTAIDEPGQRRGDESEEGSWETVDEEEEDQEEDEEGQEEEEGIDIERPSTPRKKGFSLTPLEPLYFLIAQSGDDHAARWFLDPASKELTQAAEPDS